jgi:hypothetical protein
MLDRLVLKENDVFAVTDRDGNIQAQTADGQGLYRGESRFLSVYEVFDRARPRSACCPAPAS